MKGRDADMQFNELVTDMVGLSRLYFRVDVSGAVSALAASDARFDAWAHSLAGVPPSGAAWPLDARLRFVRSMQRAGYRFALVEPETAASDRRVQAALSATPTA